jgi:arylsulfatase A-like enzyme
MNAARAARVFIMAWDGMRPDLVSPELTPNLASLGARGVVFDSHHAVVPTVTRVNAATLATSAPPAVHGLPANAFYAPAVDPRVAISVGEGDNVAQLQQAYGVFAATTMADVVHRAGGRTVILHSGTRGCAQMLHPRRQEAGDLMLHPTLSTAAELAPFVEKLGPLPEAEVPDSGRNDWLTRAAEIVVPEQRPDLLMFWHDDPDKTQHKYGFGHPLSLRAIREADDHLGKILASYEAAGLREETLVVVTSDHGYVHVRERFDVRPLLARLGADENVIVAPNGGSVLLHQVRPDAAQLARIAAELRRLPEIGVLFSGVRGAEPVAGTFPLAEIGMDGPLAPDLLATMAWSDDENELGYRGVSAIHGASTEATHGGASSWEIRNTLIVQGPGIVRGERSSLPSGVADLAPTVLTTLGLPLADTMAGRPLAEGLEGASGPAGGVEHWDETSEAGTLTWSSYGGRRYLNAGRR